jgi:hypothetical protein
MFAYSSAVNMKRWTALGLAMLLAIGLTAWITSNRSRAEVGASAPDAPSWLFSLSSDGGAMTKNADGSYLLTLTGADDAITAFTDRPVRDTAIVPLKRAVLVWPQVFASAAPNAVLVEHDPQGDSDSFVVELSDPKLLTASTVTFHAEVVDNAVQPASLTPITNAVYAVPPAVFGAASLFIDDVTTTTVNIPPSAVCTSSTGSEITPPGNVPTSSETGGFDSACTTAGGTVDHTAGEHETIPS